MPEKAGPVHELGELQRLGGLWVEENVGPPAHLSEEVLELQQEVAHALDAIAVAVRVFLRFLAVHDIDRVVVLADHDLVVLFLHALQNVNGRVILVRQRLGEAELFVVQAQTMAGALGRVDLVKKRNRNGLVQHVRRLTLENAAGAMTIKVGVIEVIGDADPI